MTTIFARNACFLAAAILSASALVGCAGPGPTLGPVAPLRVEHNSPTETLRAYDMTGDTVEDYREQLDAQGLITQIELLQDDAHWRVVRRSDNGAFSDNTVTPASRDLLVILDSVPFEMVRDAWRQGRFRYFHAPTRLISAFPVMTDLALAEFFGVSPCQGMEARHYDGARITDGFGEYLKMSNAPWLDGVDYRLYPLAHSVGYLHPEEWFAHEMARTQHYFGDYSGEDAFVAYAVGTSGLGAQRGRDGHAGALALVDRMCQRIMWETNGAARITLMSDHGHAFFTGKRVSLPKALSRLGYRVTDRLTRDDDVIVPEFGTVTCAAVHTLRPAAVARDLVSVEGVELAAHLNDDGEVVVHSRDGLARIQRRDDRYRYIADSGDPLALGDIQAGLLARGAIDAEGFVSDADWLAVTLDHRYPDPLARLWRAFHGLMTNQPQVLVSLSDGYFSGADSVSSMIDLRAAHGNLNRDGSCGFIMTTAGALPASLRINVARHELEKLGFRLPLIHGRGH